MLILGISAYYHDSAVCLVEDGKIIFAAQEERFSRVKHDPTFPHLAVKSALSTHNLKIEDIDYVAFYDKPFVKFERILETHFWAVPRGLPTFIKAVPSWIKKKLWLRKQIQDELNYKGEVIFTEHHESHAASAFYPSPFKKAAFLTLDGVGEWTTTSFGVGDGNKLKPMGEIKFPHSLGLLYSAFTYYLGFKVNSGEYKVMGLAPYGEPKYTQKILDHLIDVKDDGSFHLNLKYFNYAAGLTMTNQAFHDLFGGPPRSSESKLTQKTMDLARSLQEVTEEIVMKIGQHVYKTTKQKNLTMAGGVALNCVANGRLLREGPFKDIWIQPASGDAGGALGAALAVWYQYLGKKRNINSSGQDLQQGSYLGPAYSDNYIERFLKSNKIAYKKLEEKDLIEKTAELINKQKVIGWYQGRMEFGPRALGNRSIIGDARSQKMQKIMNLKIKYRESFRPFAPSALEEHAHLYFDLDRPSPYMLLVASVTKDKSLKLSKKQKNYQGLKKLTVKRSQVPAITHVDGTARLQTVSKITNPKYHSLLNAFYTKYDCPVVINTSFNVRGEPIVCTPEDAFKCFMRTEMDYLVLGSFLLDKKKQVQDKKYQKEVWQKNLPLD